MANLLYTNEKVKSATKSFSGACYLAEDLPIKIADLIPVVEVCSRLLDVSTTYYYPWPHLMPLNFSSGLLQSSIIQPLPLSTLLNVIIV